MGKKADVIAFVADVKATVIVSYNIISGRWYSTTFCFKGKWYSLVIYIGRCYNQCVTGLIYV